MDVTGIQTIATAATRYEIAQTGSVAANARYTTIAAAYSAAWDATEDADEAAQIEVDALRYYAEAAHTVSVEAAEQTAAARNALQSAIAENFDAATSLVGQASLPSIIDELVTLELAIAEGAL